MKKYFIYLLFPFLLNPLYAAEEKKEPKEHKFIAEETFMLTENTTQNLVKGKYKYLTKRLEHLLEGSFDYIKADDVKRKLFRAHYKFDFSIDKIYTFFDTDYQDDRVSRQVLYVTTGLGRKLKNLKIDLGWGYKIIDEATVINVLSSSIEGNKKMSNNLSFGGNFRVKKPLKSPKKPSIYFELNFKYRLSDHFNFVVSYNWMQEKPKEEIDSWRKYALRVGFGLER